MVTSDNLMTKTWAAGAEVRAVIGDDLKWSTFGEPEHHEVVEFARELMNAFTEMWMIDWTVADGDPRGGIQSRMARKLNFKIDKAVEHEAPEGVVF